MEKFFFGIAYTAYAVATSLFIGYALTRREVLARTGKGALVAAAVTHLISLAFRTAVARNMPGHDWYVPWSNWFESFSFFSLIIIVEYLIIQRQQEIPVLGAFVTPLAFLTVVVAVHSPFGAQIPTLTPALQSYWMAIHVPVMFIAYAAFANAFAVGVVYLLQERQLKSRKPSDLMFRLPALDALDYLIYKIIAFALPTLVIGILLGARWAYDTWGRYWGWDPKETSAFITVLAYAAYLILRVVGGWRGRKTAYLSLFGFLVLIGSYIGVNYISPLHGFLSAVGR